MAGLDSYDGRMMIDSVIWALLQRDKTDSHIAIANAAPTQYGNDSGGKPILYCKKINVKTVRNNRYCLYTKVINNRH